MGALDRLFKQHGCWKSENAKDGYVDDSVERPMLMIFSVTKQLGLLHSYFCGPSFYPPASVFRKGVKFS